MPDVSSQLPTVIDLFAGAGGMSEGFRAAGFHTALAIEFDEMAATTYRYNHPDTPLIVDDIRNVTNQQIASSLSCSGVTNVDVVCGGPPCQGFSLAGQRLADDPRNRLFEEFVRVVSFTKPKFFVFENVSGLVSMAGGAILRAILNEFIVAGYSCSYRLMNAADYGVPQARPRFVIIGSRAGKEVGFPDPTHVPATSADLFLHNKPKQLTVWDALSDLPSIEEGQGAEEMLHSCCPATDYQRERRGSRRPGTLFNHRATAHSEPILKRYAAIPEGGDNSQVPLELRTKKINVFKLHRDRPARTITCNHRTDILHPVIPRGTTVREAARLQSFDDDYRFFGNLTRKAKWLTQDDQVGNAVPPLLAKAIALHLVRVRNLISVGEDIEAAE
jgi:DNA (cytosine-5)-methyltransferase 1